MSLEILKKYWDAILDYKCRKSRFEFYRQKLCTIVKKRLPVVFCEKPVLIYFAKFAKKHLRWCPVSRKLQTWSYKFATKLFHCWLFPINFVNFRKRVSLCFHTAIWLCYLSEICNMSYHGHKTFKKNYFIRQ